MPLDRRRSEGEVLIFAGRRWRIDAIDHDKRRVELLPARIGKLPRTGGGTVPVHDRVRQEMRAVLMANDPPQWLDDTATSLLKSACQQFRALDLGTCSLIQEGSAGNLFIWHGDRVQDALAALLCTHGLKAENLGICIQVARTSRQQIIDALGHIATAPCPKAENILNRKSLGNPEKWDWVLPDSLFYASYSSSRLDLEKAHAMSKYLYSELKN